MEILITSDGQSVDCIVPIPNHYLVASLYPTDESVRQRLRDMYPLRRENEHLWDAFPDAFGQKPAEYVRYWTDDVRDKS
jgi:hypothetical protein